MLRTGIIAIVMGAVLARFRRPLGGVWFLNWLRPRLSITRGVQVAARVGVWFLGGTGLAIRMGLTAMVLGCSCGGDPASITGADSARRPVQITR
jgi:hypothetical protein